MAIRTTFLVTLMISTERLVDVARKAVPATLLDDHTISHGKGACLSLTA
jgi:hypothetical protein